MHRQIFLAFALPALVLGAGCGSQTETTSPPPGKTTDGKTGGEDGPVRVERVKVAALPKLEEPFPADQGRIEVARPKGWKPDTSRLKDVVYLCRSSEQAAYPRIYVFANDYPGLDRVTADTALEF